MNYWIPSDRRCALAAAAAARAGAISPSGPLFPPVCCPARGTGGILSAPPCERCRRARASRKRPRSRRAGRDRRIETRPPSCRRRPLPMAGNRRKAHSSHKAVRELRQRRVQTPGHRAALAVVAAVAAAVGLHVQHTGCCFCFAPCFVFAVWFCCSANCRVFFLTSV